MRLLLSWLRDYVEVDAPPKDIAHALTMAGMAVDAVEEQDGDAVFEFDITSNRPDAMNHFGMARELAAVYRQPLKAPPCRFTEQSRAAENAASVAIEDPDDCSRYVGRVFTDVAVRPSPDWMRRRLELCGVRPINNLADLTNYVLLETGQPTHAFDLDKLGGRRIVVRRARAGETLVTLDGQARALSPDQLAICDADKPVALAGVMGGAESEITDSTCSVLLEAAWFKPTAVRGASRHFKLFTDASHRFERGADWNATVWAADRIATLLQETESGQVLMGLIDCFPQPTELPVIRLERERLEKCLGIAIAPDEVGSILESLGFEPEADSAGWNVPARSHRLDITRPIDLVEEVARIHGFARIPATLPAIGSAPDAPAHESEEARLRADARALGYDETIGFSFVSSDEAQRFGGGPAVALRNPLSQVWDVLRNNAVPTMLRALERNLRRGQSLVRLAEFGRTYEKSGNGYREPAVLTLGASGTARPASWSEPARPVGYYDIKADVEALLAPFATGEISFSAEGLPSYYRAGHAAVARARDEIVAYCGEVEPGIAKQRKIRQAVLVAEIFPERLFACGLRKPGHGQLPKVPSVTRDLSLIVPDAVRFESVLEAAGEAPDLVSLEPVEVFRGKHIPPGHFGLLLRASWQRLETSLTDEEVNAFAASLRSALESRLGIRVRD